MCRTCGAWYRNPQWVPLQPESPELMALCVRRVKGLKGMGLDEICGSRVRAWCLEALGRLLTFLCGFVLL